MKKIMPRAAVLLALVLMLACNSKSFSKNPPNDPKTLVIGTFNMEWLGDGIDDKKKPRTEDDYKLTADALSKLSADIVGVEEIENAGAIQRVLKYLPDYDFAVGKEGGEQNVGIIYRKDLKVEPIGEYMPVAVTRGRNRPGFVAKIQKGNFDAVVMVLHLKSTSRYDSTDAMRRESIDMRRHQAEIVDHWADSIIDASSEKDVFIVGDFNDFPLRQKNGTLDVLYKDSKLKFLTDSTMSCKFAGKYTIDQIVVSKSALKRFKPGSVSMYDLNSAYGKEKSERISDHCPVTARFETESPDND